MSLGDAYSIGVRITGDTTNLRQQLRQARLDVESFGKSVVGSLNAAAAQAQAATAAEQAVGRVGRAGRRQAQDTQQAAQQTRRATQEASSSFEEYQRRATKAQDDVGRASEEASRRTETSLAGLGSTLGRLTGFAGMALLVKQIWQTGIGFHEFSQNAEVAFSGMLGGLEQAKSYLADILAFAKQTPFSFPDLAQNAQQLLAMNVAAKDVIPTLRALGDAAVSQGRGMEQVDQLARTIGQMQSLGTAGSEQLRRFQEAGIDSFKILANQAGVTTAEYQKMVTEGLVPADQAIRGLVQGINAGTDGINGQTQALGGFMASLKGSGGITATTDAARSSFRNMSAALTESLLPSYISFLRLVTDGMGVVKAAAQVFGAWPEPLRNAALAVVALTAAHRVLHTQARMSGVWTSIVSGARQAAIGTRLAAVRAGELRLALSGLGGVARSTMGLFGGPWGLAITGAALAITSFASAQAQARDRARELTQTLDEQRRVTDETRERVIETLQAGTGLFGGGGSTFDFAEELGLSLELVTDAALGNVDALRQVDAALSAIDASGSSLEADHLRYAIGIVQQGVSGSNRTIDEAIRIAEQKARADGQSADAAISAGSAYQYAAGGAKAFSEEQQKAIDQAGAAALKALPSTSALRLDIATQEDVAQARDKVEQATRRLRDAEDARRTTASRENVTESDRVRAAEAVGDARKALQEATEQLGETEARTDPVAQYRQKVEGILEATKTFESDMRSLADQGLNAKTLADLYAAGVEGSADDRKALMADPSLIGFANEARTTMDAYGDAIESQARLTQTAILRAGEILGGDLGMSFKIAALEGSEDTIHGIAERLGAEPQEIYAIGKRMGLTFLDGLRDAFQVSVGIEMLPGGWVQYPDGSIKHPGTGPSGLRMFAAGGIYPGYTPGRDVGYIGVSGGEAIMRPEWTRAVGPGYVDRMNAIARSSGVAGVQAEMRRYLGGFAQGGIPASPQVVTVPVSSTNEHYAPITIGQVVAQDVADFERQARQRRRRNNMIGG